MVKPDLPQTEDAQTDAAKLRAVLVFCAATAFVMAPVLSAPFTGFDVTQFPTAPLPPPVQPAGYAFALWGVIYLWLLANAAFGLFKRATDAGWDHTRAPLLVSLTIGATWIAIAGIAPVTATALIFLMLMGAAIALLRAGEADRAWLALPLGLYAGWLTAASFVALATILMGHDILPRAVAGFAGLLGALGVALILMARLPFVPTYPLGVIWALIGVIVAQWQSDPALSIAAALGAGLLAYRMISAKSA